MSGANFETKPRSGFWQEMYFVCLCNILTKCVPVLYALTLHDIKGARSLFSLCVTNPATAQDVYGQSTIY